jgi:hypothetical protein
MRHFATYFVALLAGVCAAQDWTNNSTEPIEAVPPPWKAKGTVYSILFLPISQTLPTKAFAPLERQHASAMEGEFQGELGSIQIIRYKESPVGPYDEMFVIPGFWKYNHTDSEGNRKEQKNVRISRIYVSQKYTAWNGRNNWNIPKHLARFDWTNDWRGTTVKIYPHDTTGDKSEANPAQKPWFQTTFTEVPIVRLPFSTTLYKLLGVDANLAQPPLPSADSKYHELAGTNRWALTEPFQEAKYTSLGVFDMNQAGGDALPGQQVNAVGDEYFKYFWPGLSPVHAGMRLEDAEIGFSDPEIWVNN